MKTKLAAALLAAIVSLLLLVSPRAQESPPALVTNNLTVVISAEVDTSLRNAWRLDNHARTNALYPYAQLESALTYREYREQIGKQAFEAAAVQARQQNEAYIMNTFRGATDDIQMRIVRILSGKE